MATEVYLEIGSKKVFACAVDWPGWCRAGKTEDAAVEALAAYAERYARVAELAGVRFPASAGATIEVVDRVQGSATTDFGAPGVPAPVDSTPLTAAQAKRIASLVEASWTVFDRIAAAAPPSLRKGPRGGGRDRDKIVEHVVSAEPGYARMIGVRRRAPAPDDTAAIAELRAAVLDALRAARHPLPEATTKVWPYRYGARRFAWHALDHAWEIEDRTER